jgi:menaquinone-dependent protoporphyrinogen oxidase
MAAILEDSKVISIQESENINLDDFKTIIIGASIRYGKHRPEVYKFIKNNFEILNNRNNAFLV